MQTNNYSSGDYAEIGSKMEEDFANKLKINASHRESEDPESKIQSLDEKPQSSIHSSPPGSESGDRKPNIQSSNPVEDHGEDYEEEEEEDDDDDDDDFEFTFACSKDCSPIAADKVFQNGQIRPAYPLFDTNLLFLSPDGSQPETRALRPPLKKLFVDKQERDGDAPPSSPDQLEGVPEDTYCVWDAGRTVEDASPDAPRKSNSTGFSKLWMFRDMRRRSCSDGKDAFVFLNDKSEDEKAKSKKKSESDNSTIKEEETKTKTKKKRSVSTKPTTNAKGKTVPSAHEKHYLKNRAMKEGRKRKSYLPYRQDLVGIFTNVNVLSKNVHPY